MLARVSVLVGRRPIMYKATIRALLRHAVKKLNAGDYSMLLKMASPDFELAFPGDNSWATTFR